MSSELLIAENAMKPSSRHRLLRGGLLARNVFWNLAGSGVPLVAAVVCVPYLIRHMGIDRFGILTLAWTIVGYFSLFDFGLGRAVTQSIAEKLGAGLESEIPAVFWASSTMLLVFGTAGGGFLAICSRILAQRILQIDMGLQTEARTAFYLLSFAVPFVILTTGLRGCLEAYQRFAIATALRIPMGVLGFLAPVVVWQLSHNLVRVIGSLVCIRFVVCVAHWIACRQLIQISSSQVGFKWHLAFPLFRFAVWMTVTNIVGPLMVTLDRFILGAFVSMSAVAYYTTPAEITTRLLLIPAAIVGVLFPAFSTSLAIDKERTARLFRRGTTYAFFSLLAIVLLLIFSADTGLTLWVGKDFADHSAGVLRWLAVGALLNGTAQVPFALIQGAGRSDISGKLHLLELPLYFGLLAFFIHHYGVTGAAIAWTIRVAIDAILMFGFARQMLGPDVVAVNSFR